VTRPAAALIAAMGVLVAALVARAQSGPAFLLKSLYNTSERRESRSEILDTPVLPGSLMKTVTLVAALESQVIEPDTARVCRRTVTVAGRTYVCSHPDLKRALTPAEALAHSCNDFFVSLFPRLTRAAFNQVRAKVGLPPVSESANLAASFVGLDGPRLTPRAALDVVTRLMGADAQRPASVSAEARRVLLEGLGGAAEYGTASALGRSKVSATAKTGTAPMPGGSHMGLLVALSPRDRPTRAVVVVAPGVAGADAATIAADLLRDGRSTGAPIQRWATPAPLQRTDPPTTIKISVNGRINTLGLEEYVARVVAGEGQPRAAAAAQQALAITARTFALANLGRHRRDGYDLCDSTHCQVMRPATEITRRSATATAGRVLVHQGQAATVFYSALCGGRSELASEVWPGAVDYSSDSHEDDACRGEPGWTTQIRAGELERALRAAGMRGDRLRNLRIVQRNSSGRVARLRVDGFQPNEISGHDFRMTVGRVTGWQHLKSTAFDVRRTSSGYEFSGTGFGHGVGLCVIGAGHRAARGNTVDQILRFYFPTLAVESYRGPGPTLTAAPAKGDVLLALPASEEGERSRMLQALRTARDDIALRAGVKAPTVVKVTVHPTVESFARATGQPWWVSGATDGSTIDLLPLTILRQRGQLERTLRHEIAHVIIDASLKGRPLWVREGAAFYFADPMAAAEPEGRASCPRDDEFSKPLSAGTHRAAYARAEACFRRALSQGKRWNDVR
jgi:SpoIID/LytB domain protein